MSARRLPSLDGLRGLAVLLVLSFHLAGGTHSHFLPLRWFGLANKGGWAGVTLFFVLSGFLITGILWDGRTHPHPWRNFYARRSLRIFPLYALALLLVLLGAVYAHTLPAAVHQLWSPLLFLQNIPGPAFNAINHDGSPLPLFHFWSLAVEEQFYLLWPFALVRMRSERSALRLCLAVWAGSLVFRLVIFGGLHCTDEWNAFLLSRAGEMAAGGALAMAYRLPVWGRLAAPARWLLPLGLLTFAVTSWLTGTAELQGTLQSVWGLLAVTIAAAALLRLSLAGGLAERALRWGWLRWLGTVSYGVYVYHALLLPLWERGTLLLVHSTTSGRYLPVHLVVATAGTLLVASISFYGFERPISRLKRRFPVDEVALVRGTH